MATPATQLAPTSSVKFALFASPGKRRTIIFLLLTLLTIIAYNPAAHLEFVTFDDPGYVTDNVHIHAGLTWDTVKWAFLSTEYSNWHPLTWLSHAFDCQLFHERAGGHHYMSVLLHATCALLLFLFLETATGLPWRSAIVAALFAIHPLNVESVVWISERKSVLCMLFTSLTLLAYHRYTQSPNVKRYALVALLFTLALMSKPMAVTVPCVLLLLDYWPLCRLQAEQSGNHHGNWRRLVLEKVPLLALSVASSVVTSVAQRAGGAMHSEYTLWNRTLNAIVSYARYLTMGIWPTHLAAFYPHPLAFTFWPVIVSLLVLALITAAVVACRKNRYLAVGWFWYLGTMIPVIGLVQVGEQGMADRYAYFPFIGLFIAVVWGIGDLVEGRKIPTLCSAIATALILVALSAGTHVQVGYWKNSFTLWSRTLAVTENNYVAHDSMGAELLDQGKPREAAAQFEAAIRINPKDAFSYLDLGVSEKRLGYTAAAVQNYKTALLVSADPALKATALGNLASISRAAGDYVPARRDYQNALALLPGNKYALIGLGLIAQKTGDMAQAAEYYSKAVKTEPTDAEYLLLSQALKKAGHPAEAQAAYDKAQNLSRNWDATMQSVNRLLQE